MFLSTEKDQGRWGRGFAWAKRNIFPRIKHSKSSISWFSDTKNRRSLCSTTPGHGKEAPPAAIGKMVKISDAIFQASSIDLTNSRPSGRSSARIYVDTRPAHTGNPVIISDAIFDDSFDVATPKRSISHESDCSNPTQDINTASAETGQTVTDSGTVFDLRFTDLEAQRTTCHKYDDSTRTEIIDTASHETGKPAIIFHTMLDFSFQDAEGKWQAYCRTNNLNSSLVNDASPTESGKTSGTFSGFSHEDVKGKKPIYDTFVEKFGAISSMHTELATEALPRQTSVDHPIRLSNTSLQCTCTPSDARLALELYLQSTRKQHKQLKHSLRKSSGLTYFFSSSNLIVALVEKLLELYLNVEELRRLVMADEIVSSVTLTEIHRLMEKALTPVSEQVSALYSEMMVFSMVDGGWRTRKKALKQKMKEDWKPRMRALVTRVDQADAWAQLVGIRTARVRWEW
jgi:hypothetical protein